MSQQKVLRRIRLGSLVLMIGVGLELLRYLYRSFDRALTFAFFDPEQWNAHWQVDAGTIIETAPRLGYFAIWTTIILLSAALLVSNNRP